MANELSLRDAVEKFRETPPEVRQKVLSELEKGPAAISLEDLAKRVSTASTVEVETLLGLFKGWANLIAFTSRDKSFRKLMVGWASRKEGEASSSEDDASSFAHDIDRLLQCEVSIGLTAKAQAVTWGHGKVLQDGHAITQIRPLFLEKLSENSQNAVIVHELRLRYREVGVEGELCVTMDRKQIELLQRTLTRAIDKEKSLRNHAVFNYLAPLEN